MEYMFVGKLIGTTLKQNKPFSEHQLLYLTFDLDAV